MQKHRKSAISRQPAHGLPLFGDDPGHDGPLNDIDQELLGIWLSISRLRQMIRGAASDGRIIPWRRRAAAKKATPHKKPRRKAA